MKIAISGTMGSGKSQVANYLKEKGYTVSIADEVVEHLYNKDKELIKAMVDIFSSEILSWGKIDKNKLKDFYFKYPENATSQSSDS